MSTRTPDGRRIYIPRNRGDLLEDAEALIAAIIDSSAELIHSKSDGVIWINDGVTYRMGRDTLIALVGKHIATPVGFVEHKGRVEVDYRPPMLDERMLGVVLTGRAGPGIGEIKSLAARLPQLDIKLPLGKAAMKQKAEAEAKEAKVEAEKPAEPLTAEQQVRAAEDELLMKYVGSTQFDAFSRERFLRRIRTMHEEDKAKEIKPMGRTTPEQIAQLEAELEAGRAAVRKAEQR
jgi:hypothetical protein